MKKSRLGPLKWYLLFACGVTGFKVYADYNNINIWPESNETRVDHARRSGTHGFFFYRTGGNHHK